jgi:hypothetical protein
MKPTCTPSSSSWGLHLLHEPVNSDTSAKEEEAAASQWRPAWAKLSQQRGGGDELRSIRKSSGASPRFPPQPQPAPTWSRLPTATQLLPHGPCHWRGVERRRLERRPARSGSATV